MFRLTKRKAMELSNIAEKYTTGTDMDPNDFSYGADGTIFYEDATRSIALRDIESYDEAEEVLIEFIDSNANIGQYYYDEPEYGEEECDEIECDEDNGECDDTDFEPGYGDEMCKSCAIQLSIDDVIYNTLQSPEPITNQVADVMLKLAELKRVLLEVNS